MSNLTNWLEDKFSFLSIPSKYGTSPPHVSATSPVEAERVAWAKLATLREGGRLIVYLDSLNKPTVGRGHLVTAGDGLRVGDHITQAQSDAFWAKDGADAFDHAIALSAQAGITSADFLPYLASVCYQLGDAWTRKFPNTWAMICDGDYAKAADALDGTVWDEQTPTRVQDFAGALRRLPPKVKA